MHFELKHLVSLTRLIQCTIAAGFVGLAGTVFADTNEISPISGLEAPYRYVFDRSDRAYDKEKWSEHREQIKRGIQDYGSFYLNPKNPRDPFPVRCAKKGSGVKSVGAAITVPIPEDPNTKKISLLVSWERDAASVLRKVYRWGGVFVIDSLRQQAEIYEDETGQERWSTFVIMDTDYWFKRNGLINVSVVALAGQIKNRRNLVIGGFETDLLKPKKSDFANPGVQMSFMVTGCTK